MSKYGQIKYSQAKYGRYSIKIRGKMPLQQLTNYRLRTIDKNNKESRAIINQSIQIPNTKNESLKIRIRANNGKWVHHQQTTIIDGSIIKTRIKSVGKNDSPWVELAVGTMRKE